MPAETATATITAPTFQHRREISAKNLNEGFALLLAGVVGIDPLSGAKIYYPADMTGYEETVGFAVRIPHPTKADQEIEIGVIEIHPDREDDAVRMATKRFGAMYRRHFLQPHQSVS